MVFYDKYERGAAIRLNAHFQDRNDVYIDPTSPVIKITKPDGSTLVEYTALTKSETGKYFYIFDSVEDSIVGDYTITAKGTYSGHVILNRYLISLTDSTVSS